MLVSAALREKRPWTEDIPQTAQPFTPNACDRAHHFGASPALLVLTLGLALVDRFDSSVNAFNRANERGPSLQLR